MEADSEEEAKEKAEELIEATAKRMVFGGSTEVPFANQTVHVTGVCQHVGAGCFGGRQPVVGILVVGSSGVELVPEPSLISAGQQACA